MSALLTSMLQDLLFNVLRCWQGSKYGQNTSSQEGRKGHSAFL